MSTRRFLWLLVALLAIVDLLAVFRDSLALTVLHVVTLLTFAVVHGSLRYGPNGILAFAAICLVVSNVIENIGVATGFPFGLYHYTDALGPKLGHVPLLIAPAYFGVGYLSWVLATVLVGDIKRGAYAPTTFTVPLIGAFIMVLWDMTLDPLVSTQAGWWIWEKGGGFFGVPLSNFLGWYLTVFILMQVFALYLNARGPETTEPQPKSYFLQAAAMYAIIALQFVVNYAVKGSVPLMDATAITWRSGDLLEASAITAIFGMLFVVALALVKIAGTPTKVASMPD